MGVTLADIANAAGLSGSTVSRALSAPEKVNPSTREKVRRIAKELGYVSTGGRASSSTRANQIGLLVPDISNPFFPPIIKAVQSRAASRGRTVLIGDIDERPADEIVRARLIRREVDGLIVASPRTPEENLHELSALQPIVFINREVPGASSILVDPDDGLWQAVQHLHALGHRRIAYLNGPKRSWSNTQRQSSVRSASKELGIELVELGPFEPQIQSGVHAADLLQTAGVTAVIAYDDLIALGVITRLTERGLRAGSDISVIGIDDSPMSAMAYPTLTSVQVPGPEAGIEAVDQLIALIDGSDGGDPQTRRLETRLIVRSSTGINASGS